MTKTAAPATTPTTCRRCGRRLTSARAISLAARNGGYGRTCATKIHDAAVDTAERHPRETAQVEKALELIEDGGIVRLTASVLLAVSSDGTTIYEVVPLTGSCSCKAGSYQRRCYHLLAAELVGVPVPPAPIAPAGTIGRELGTVPADPFAAFRHAA